MTWARRSADLARLVLAWFVLALGVATAAPLLQPVSTQVVCNADGELRTVVVADDGTVTTHSHVLLCALCLLGPGTAPAPAHPHAGLRAPAVTTAAMDPTAAVIPHSHSRAPLPARGPPLAS